MQNTVNLNFIIKNQLNFLSSDSYQKSQLINQEELQARIIFHKLNCQNVSFSIFINIFNLHTLVTAIIFKKILKHHLMQKRQSI